MNMLLPLLGYLFGSLPSGVILGRILGRDPRQEGSGNLGASNVGRTLGRRWGVLVLSLDLLKGCLPVLLAPDPQLAALTGLAAVLGHCFPVWLRFRGGKGVATSFGVMLALAPVIALLSALSWAMILILSRTPTYSSLSTVLLFPLLSYLDGQPLAILTMTLFLSGLILLRHRSNLMLIWRGETRTLRLPLRRQRLKPKKSKGKRKRPLR